MSPQSRRIVKKDVVDGHCIHPECLKESLASSLQSMKLERVGRTLADRHTTSHLPGVLIQACHLDLPAGLGQHSAHACVCR